ncbi:hypothetical protein S40288_01454, partial [Stachybotrys chartarum IBT 40288]
HSKRLQVEPGTVAWTSPASANTFQHSDRHDRTSHSCLAETACLRTGHLSCVARLQPSWNRHLGPGGPALDLLPLPSTPRELLDLRHLASALVPAGQCHLQAHGQLPPSLPFPRTAVSHRGEVDVDRPAESRSHPVDDSNDASAPTQNSIATGTALSGQQPSASPEPTPSRPETAAAPVNIGSSTGQAPWPSVRAPLQVLGRRRRPSLDHLQHASSELPTGGDSSLAPAEGALRSPKRRRFDQVAMSGEGDDGMDRNGSVATSQSTQSTAAATQRSAMTNVTNGNHKLASVTNGSSGGDRDSTPALRRRPDYFGHSREEVTRILIQALSDMGYPSAAEIVSHDSGYELESPTVAAFRSAVLAGSWAEAEQLLDGAATTEATGAQGNGLVLAAGSDKDVMRFWIRQQKFLELLEQRDSARALMVLRSELSPLYHDSAKVHFLSSLLMCRSTEDLMAKAAWDGARGESRRSLLSELSRCISPSVMLPENRLAVLLQQVKQSQIDTCLYHTEASSPSLYADHLCDRRNFPTEVGAELSDLDGEVWQVQFSHDGSKLAACGSKDTVVIWETQTFSKVLSLREHGDGGVGNLAWSPDDSMLVTCSQDKRARLWNTKTGELMKRTECFSEPVIGCVWALDGQTFVLGTLDRNHSLRTANIHDNEYFDWNKKHRVQDLCGSPDGRWLVAVDERYNVHVYNALTRELAFELEFKERPMSVAISEDSRHLLINKSDGEAQLIDLITRSGVQKFLGHTGGNFVIRSAFGGANESFIASGSEDGNILIWHKNTGAAIERLVGHYPRCNAVSWNPADPCMLVSCGDDNIVKVWTNPAKAAELESRRPATSNGWSNADDEA